jgi:protein-disulfide isomerase
LAVLSLAVLPLAVLSLAVLRTGRVGWVGYKWQKRNANARSRNRFAKKYPTARFYKVDVDEVPDVAQELGISAMPTFVIFNEGDVADKVVGANPHALESAIVRIGNF